MLKIQIYYYIVVPCWSASNFCFTSLVIVSILAKTSGAKFCGIANPYDVFPSRFLNTTLALVSSSILVNIKKRL